MTPLTRNKVFVVDFYYQMVNLLIMKANMGSADRIIRVIIAVILGTLYFTGIIPGTLGIVIFLLAIVFVITSLINFCPLYVLFKLNTLGKKKTNTKI